LHDVAPVPAWLVPAAQFEHTLALDAEYVPTMHGEQLKDDVLPVAPRYLPPEQAMHAFWPVPD